MITVMGATGQIGQKIVQQLREAGEPVRALGRSLSKLSLLEKMGAEVYAGEGNDTGFLTEMFRDAKAAFAMMPYDPFILDYNAQQDKIGVAIREAIGNTKVPNVVFLSSVGAHLPSGTGFITSLHRQEQRLRTLQDTSLLVLRPAYFFENLYAALPSIRRQGTIADSISPHVPIPMVGTCDIANVAVEALRTNREKGIAIRELLGPCDLCMSAVTQILGERLKKPDLRYVSLSETEMSDELQKIGFAHDFAVLYTEMTSALNNGTIQAGVIRTAENSTPTHFKEFTDEFAQAYEEESNGEY